MPYQFWMLRMCGLWYENSEQFILLKKLYRYTILLILCYFTLGQTIELWVMRDSIDDLTEILFLTVTYFVLLIKIFNILREKKKVEVITNCFHLEVCQGKSAEEQAIIKKDDNFIKILFFSIMIMSQSCGTFFVLKPFLEPVVVLPFKAHIFFDTSNSIKFKIAYFIQTLAIYYGICINVSLDTMAYGYFIKTAGQFELISHRFRKFKEIDDEHTFLKSIINHD